MKSIFTDGLAAIFAVSIMFTTILRTQPHDERLTPPPGSRPEQMFGDLKERLELTDAQMEKVKALFKEQRKRIQQQRMESEDRREEEREQMMEQMEKSRKEIDAQISVLLTPEQKKKFQAMKQEQWQDHWHKQPQENQPRPDRLPKNRE